MPLLTFPLKNVLWSKKENNQHTCIVKAIVFLMKQNEQQLNLKDLKKRDEEFEKFE